MSCVPTITLILSLLCLNYSLVFARRVNDTNLPPGPRTSPWTPIIAKNRYGYHLPLAASESRSFSTSDDRNYGGNSGAVIKHRESGATVGLDIPDSNLRLLLDIDELASKPSADAIKLKVIDRDGSASRINDRRSPVSYARSIPQAPQGVDQANKPYTLNPSSSGKQYKIGFIRASDIHTAINSGAIPPGSQPFPVPSSAFIKPQMPNVVMSASSGSTIQTNGQYQVKYSQPLPGDENKTSAIRDANIPEVHKYPSNFVESPAPQAQAASLTAAASYSKTNTRQVVQQEQQQVPQSKTNGKTNKRNKINSKTNSQRKAPTTTPAPATKSETQSDEGKKGLPAAQRVSPSDSSKTNRKTQQQQQKFSPEDEQQKTAAGDVSDEQDDVDIVRNDDDQGLDQSNDDNEDGFGDNVQVKDISVERNSQLRTGSGERNSVEDDSDDEEDFDLIKVTKRRSSSDSCGPITRSFSGDSDSMTMKEFAARLGADAIFSMFPGMEDQMQTVVDFANSGYTIFLPSNEAMSRLPKTLINRLKSKPEELRKLVDNHVSDEKQSMKQLRTKDNLEMKPRASSSKLRVSRVDDSIVTVNGQRVIQMNQRGPMGGSVHVIDGLLYPVADKSVMETLKSCNRFDGFVTLAEGTGLGETLSKGGPYTIFVPSNEALQKIPDNDLERIRSNMTALKQFLMYHIADGSFYSSDLKDGQFVPSLVPDQEIQVGVRVDGCSRRLVEANVSPLYRADIPASNGVIHVVDWILKPNDRDWCDGVILPRKR